MDCLDNLVGKHLWRSKGGNRKNAFDKTYNERMWEHLPQPPWKTSINSFHAKSIGDSRQKVGSSIEFHNASMTKKNWRNTVIMVRFSSTLLQWCLSRLLNVYHDISPLAVNRVVIWCTNKERKKRLEEMGLCIILEVESKYIIH